MQVTSEKAPAKYGGLLESASNGNSRNVCGEGGRGACARLERL